MIDLSGKTALITGASRGIGEGTAYKFAEYGANVVLCARSSDDITRIAKDIGSRALAVSCDVASYEDVVGAMNRAKKHFGGLNVLVNNAGLIDPISRLEDSDPAKWGQVIDVNVKGVYHCMHAAYPLLKLASQNNTNIKSVIINISSGAASGAMEGWSHYCSSKAAVLSLTRCAHKEWAGEGIRTIGLSPGTVATHMQTAIKKSQINPVSQLDWSAHISPEWVGEAIAWLTTDAAHPFDGDDFSIKTDEGRRLVGLIK